MNPTRDVRAKCASLELAWCATELQSRPEDWNLTVPAGLQCPPPDAPTASLDATGESYGSDHAMADFAEQILATIYDGPGVALLHGAPADDEERAKAWLGRLARYLGQPVPQSFDGAMIGRVEDLGADHANPTHRGHKTSAALAFHSDRTDVIALLCVRNAAQGGLSRIASAARVRSVLAAEAPDLLKVLERPYPYDRRGEEGPGELPWTTLPIFSALHGKVIARYIRRFVESSQRHSDAPRLTRQQIRAMDAVDEILDRPEVVYEMELKAGQVQLIENHAVMHGRSAFHGGDRLLLRLWLSTPRSPELPADFAAVYGATAAGAVRGGVWPQDRRELIGTPVAVHRGQG